MSKPIESVDVIAPNAVVIPRIMQPAFPVNRGDIIHVISDKRVKIGDNYENYNGWIVQVFYENKKKWQFWKKKKQTGFFVYFYNDDVMYREMDDKEE